MYLEGKINKDFYKVYRVSVLHLKREPSSLNTSDIFEGQTM